jgi:hypothetical protein
VLRLLEVALFLVPFIAFGAWWWLAAGRGPSTMLVAAAAVAVIVLAVALVWFSGQDTLGPGKAYVPARVKNGEIVPGHAAPP